MKKAFSICLGIFFALALTVVFLSTTLETPVAAASGTTGDCKWSTSGTTLTISGNGAMADYEVMAEAADVPWGYSITKVVVKDGVTSIGDNTFFGFDTIKSVTLGNSVTHIGDYAFAECSSLTSITFPDSVTYIGDYAFTYCVPLKSIKIPNGVTYIGYGAFSHCESLASITVSDGNTVYHSKNNCLIETKSKTLIAGCKNSIIPSDGSVSAIDGAFDGCANLTSITIPDSVTSIGDFAFSDCYSLTSITIPDSVISIGTYAFFYCGSLTSVTIGKGVTSIGSSAFSCCYSLTSITLPFVGARKDGTTNTHFSYIFGASSNYYNSYYVPDSLRTVVITGGTTIGNSAFSSCDSLTSITIPDSVTSIGKSAFSGCESLTSITLPFVGARKNGTTNTHFGYIFGAPDCYENCSEVPYSLKTVVITGGTSIGDCAFYECSYIESITIPNSVTTIGESAFYDCFSIESITIPNSVTTIGDYALSGCHSLTSITIPKSVTTIGDGVFCECYLLESIVVEKDNPNYHSSGNCLIETKSKTLLSGCMSSVIPSDGSVTVIADQAFWGSDIQSIVIPDTVTTIGDYAFFRSLLSGSVVIPASVTSIGECAFGETSLESVIFSDGVTTIPSSTFWQCSLTSVTIPGSVTSIGDSAFSWCESLSDVWYEGTKTAAAKISIGSDNEDLTNATWHYVDNSCDKTCNVCGKTRAANSHTYSNVCDATCNNCGATRTITHYTKELTTATPHTLKNDATYPFATSGDWTVSTNKVKSTTSAYTITASHACTLTLNYKVSSEAGYDKMTVKKNSTTLDTISGEVEKSTTITLAKGDTVTVSYAKDGRTDGGSDCAYFKFSCICEEEREVPSSTLSPTCTQGVVCSRCGVTVKSAAGHKYDNACDTTCNTCGATRSVPAHVYSNTCDTSCNVCGETRTITHTYSNTCDTSCNVCGATRTVTHTYSNNCDTTCNVCGATRTVGAHVYDNTCDETCNECGAKRSVTHTYDNTCDTACNICGATRTITHTYSNACDTSCNVCGATRTTGAHVYTDACDSSCNVCGAARTAPHDFTNDCDTTCNVCGATRTVPAHVYDSVCDETCNECGEKRSVTHTYDDDYDETCNVCGAVRSVVLALRTTLSKSVIDHGDTVVVSFSLSKPVSTRGFGLDYSAIYDKDAFEWVSGDWSEQIRTNSMLAQANPGTQAVFAATTAFNVSGEIFTMTLRVKDGAKCGIQKIDAPQITQIQNVTLIGSEIEVNHVFDDAKDLICNACGYERPPYTPGDVDDNGKVEMADAIYLLFHVNFPTNYPVNQSVDFDGNGKVEMADAIYLLFHVNFPASYPLH